MFRWTLLRPLLAMAVAAYWLVGCNPEVGSEAWCDAMEDKPKGDWSTNEAADYAKNCVFRNDND